MAITCEDSNRDALDAFGQFLMREVRDATIERYDRVFAGQMKDNFLAPALDEVLPTLDESQRAFVDVLVSEVVTNTLAKLLWATEQTKVVNVLVTTQGGDVNVRKASDGLEGELWGKYGWIKKYSTKRASGYSLGED